MAFEFAEQPWKALYLLYAVAKLFLLIPWWALKNVLPSTRPHPSWTFKRSFLLCPYRYFGDVLLRTGNFLPMPDHRKAVQGKGYWRVWVEGVPELIKGSLCDWATKARTECIAIPGYWIVKPGTQVLPGQKPTTSEKIIYYIHGGGFVSWSAHPNFQPACNIPRGVLDACPTATRVFSIEYRSCTAPPFGSVSYPTPIVDALAGYNYLINTIGCSPSNVVIVGDSAGGHIAQGLIRYLVASKLPGLPVPAGLVLLSPSTDLNFRPLSPMGSLVRNEKTDFVGNFLESVEVPHQTYVVRAVLGSMSFENSLEDPYISPASPCLTEKAYSFAGFPKTIITVGGLEMLLDSIRILGTRMRARLGKENVTCIEQEYATHDCILFPWHEPERGELLREIGEWVSSL